MALIERVCVCGNRWDDLVGMVQEEDWANCPECGEKSLRTTPGTFALSVCGVERMGPLELKEAYANKRWIESRASEVHSGEVNLKTKSSVPLELRPEIPKRLH